MDKSIALYLYGVIDLSFGIGFEKELYAFVWGSIYNKAVVLHFGQFMPGLTKIVEQAMASVPGAACSRYNGLAFIQCYAIIVGKYIEAMFS